MIMNDNTRRWLDIYRMTKRTFDKPCHARKGQLAAHIICDIMKIKNKYPSSLFMWADFKFPTLKIGMAVWAIGGLRACDF